MKSLRRKKRNLKRKTLTSAKAQILTEADNSKSLDLRTTFNRFHKS